MHNGDKVSPAIKDRFAEICARLRVDPKEMTLRLKAALVEAHESQKGDRFAIPLEDPRIERRRYVAIQGRKNEPITVYPNPSFDPFPEDLWQDIEKRMRRKPGSESIYRGFSESLKSVPFLAKIRERRACDERGDMI